MALSIHQIDPSTYLFCGARVWIAPAGGTLGISGRGFAAGTLETLAYARASLAKFCYLILE